MISDVAKRNDLEYHLEKQFVLGLRSTFMDECEFKFDSDLTKTKLEITTDYPQRDKEFKIPQLVIANVSYNLTETSLCNNYMNAIIKEVEGQNVTVGERYATVVPYNLSIIAFASNSSISKDLANRVANILHFEAMDFFSTELNLNIRSVSKSPTSLYNTNPNRTFMTSVSISGNIHWVGEKYYKKGNYLKNLETILIAMSKENKNI